jgi:hypothetical protein
MKIDFDSKIVDLAGNEVPIKEDNVEVPLTLKSVSINSLMSQTKENESGEVKLKNYKLAERIFVGGVVEIEAEEITLLKEKIALFWGTLVVGCAGKILENPITE